MYQYVHHKSYIVHNLPYVRMVFSTAIIIGMSHSFCRPPRSRKGLCISWCPHERFTPFTHAGLWERVDVTPVSYVLDICCLSGNVMFSS